MANISIQRAIRFGEHDGTTLQGDLYLPAGDGPFPAFVLAHGGAWTRGSRQQWSSWGEHLARQGVLAYAPTYRLATRGAPGYPSSAADLRAAIQFLRANPLNWPVDPERIGGFGFSAGAHLTALVALAGDGAPFTDAYPQDEHRNVSATLSVVVGVCGIYDVLAKWEHDQLHRPLDAMTETFMGGTPMDRRTEYYAASPIYHASSQNCLGTRWLIAWGEHEDQLDHRQQSIPFAHHVKRAGGLVHTAVVPGANHFWFIDSNVGESTATAYFAGRLSEFIQGWSGWYEHPRL